ncbi:MAG: porin, partial [Candidatus Zixiibacteriota bacterium]
TDRLIGSTQTNKNKSTVGPFEIYNADSTSSIRFQLAGQLRMTLDSRDKGGDADRTNTLFMEARRLRLTLSGTIYDPDISYKVHLSTAPKSLELMDFYFNYRLKANLQFRYGQYKTPFTRYRIQSFQRLTFVDWAIVTKYFGAERQMGLALHNGYEKPPKWGYVFGLFTGVNARASHAVGLAKVYGEETANPSDLSESGATADYHPELFLHCSYNANNIQLNSNSDAERTGWRYSFGISSAFDMHPTDYQDFRLRLAPEILIKYRGVAIVGAGYAGYSELDNGSEMELTMTGCLIQTAYRFHDDYEISIRYALVDFQKGLTDDASERALQLIDDSGDDPEIINQYKNAGKILQENELTLGFSIYLLGHSLKWQSDFGWLRHCYDDENRDDYLARSQFQVSF